MVERANQTGILASNRRLQICALEREKKVTFMEYFRGSREKNNGGLLF